MESYQTYITLQNLEVYQLSRELSRLAWKIYEQLDWQMKKVNGDQFLTSTDSTGANIAEGYGRFHYQDKIKFYYYSRGSLRECNEHWIELLHERNKVSEEYYKMYKEAAHKFSLKLNNFIAATYRSKDNQQ